MTTVDWVFAPPASGVLIRIRGDAHTAWSALTAAVESGRRVDAIINDLLDYATDRPDLMVWVYDPDTTTTRAAGEDADGGGDA